MAVAEFILHPPDVFLFNDTATTEIYTLSLHDALPISPQILLGLSDVERHEELAGPVGLVGRLRSEEHTSELQSLRHLVCRLLLEKKKSTVGTLTESPLSEDARSTTHEARRKPCRGYGP